MVITSGRPHKAELLVKTLLRGGVEPVYTSLVNIEKTGEVDVAGFLRRIERFDIFIFVAGQSAAGLVEAAKSASLLDRS
nr:MAG: hypothetical protein TU35_09760 [Thermoproteus sp. AZ2]